MYGSLDRVAQTLRNKRVVAGFDAFIDTLARPVKAYRPDGSIQFYDTMAEMGDFIHSRAGKSGTLQLDDVHERLGGNVPILSRALGRLSLQTTCIGGFGVPQAHPVFAQMGQECELLSIGEPAKCVALEFADGKLMLGMGQPLADITWELLTRRPGLAELAARYGACDLAAFLNWSETPHATAIWQGFLRDVEPGLPAGKWMLFDLSDTVTREADALHEALQVIRRFGARHRTVMSLNENEYRDVCRALGLAQQDAAAAAQAMCTQLRLRAVYLHFMGVGHCMADGHFASLPTVNIQSPVLTTGAGDNFNAGVIAGLLAGMPPAQALGMGTMTASCYVATGTSPTLPALWQFAAAHEANPVEA